MKIREIVLAILHVLLQEVSMPGSLFIRQVKKILSFCINLVYHRNTPQPPQQTLLYFNIIHVLFEVYEHGIEFIFS